MDVPAQNVTSEEAGAFESAQGSGEEPLISVIVPAWNDSARLASCLTALTKQTMPRCMYEIIVIDNGSSDDTAAVAKSFAGAKVISEPKPGSYVARNAGLRLARGQIVAFTDSDCTPVADWLERGLAALRRHANAGIIAGRIELYATHGAIDPACQAYEQMFAFDQKRNVLHNAVATANWISSIDIPRSLGGFRAELKSGGDSDLSRRAAAAGHPIHFVSDVTVRHPIRADRGSLIGKAVRVIGGRVGLHHVRYGAVGWALKLAREAVGRIVRVMGARELGFGLRFRLSWLILEIMMASILEVRRLRRGGEAARA